MRGGIAKRAKPVPGLIVLLRSAVAGLILEFETGAFEIDSLLRLAYASEVRKLGGWPHEPEGP